MPDRYGAQPEAWSAWVDVLGGPEDLLPVVSNPGAQISANSTMQGLGKTPSRYNHDRKAVGIAKWTQLRATAAQVAMWQAEPDYGICIQTRRLRAIDIDVETSGETVRAVMRAIGYADWPMRCRDNSGKCLVPFWYDAPLSKHIIPVDGGVVEILADGQQFIAEGTHPSGVPYVWEGRAAIPVLDELEFAMLLASLREIATGEIKVAHAKRERRDGIELNTEDEVADWLTKNWEVYDEGEAGQLFIACPFADEHSSDSGPSSTAYFPAGTGGYAEGNFVCLHAHCTGRSQAEFLNASGATAGGFDDINGFPADGGRAVGATVELVGRPGLETGSGLVEEAGERGGMVETPAGRGRDTAVPDVGQDWPSLERDGRGRIEPTMRNLVLMVDRPDLVGRHIAYDVFLAELMWAPGHQPFDKAQWQAWRDSDYAWLRIELEQRGFKPMSMELLKLAVLAVSERNEIDQAATWLSRLEWDGRQRIERFANVGWGWEKTPYADAVGRYVWTALAGRIIQPGAQADMSPILVGPQGAGKTRAIKAMVPDARFYTSIKLNDRDTDVSRRMRGRLVVELEELRGLNSRESEEIKAFLSRTTEEWIPKFKEFRLEFARRLIFFGTTNDTEFLADPTGERRWLPGETTRTDPDWIAANCEQLWAEGAAQFMVDGIDWQEAELLAKAEHRHYKMTDPWAPFVIRWMQEDDVMAGGRPGDREYLTTHEVLAGAINVRSDQFDRTKEMRMGKVLRALGYERDRRRVTGEAKPVNAYFKPST